MRSKGLSTVIAIVLLLLIVIGVVWTFSAWITSFFSGATGKVENVTQKKFEELDVSFSVKCAYQPASGTLKLTIMNKGGTPITVSNNTMVVTIDSIPQTIATPGTHVLNPGTYVTLDVENTTVACDKIITVTHAGSGKEASALVEC